MNLIPIPCLAIPFALRRQWLAERTLPAVYSALAIFAVGGMLWVNALDIFQFTNRLLYGGLACWLIGFFLIRQFRRWRFWKTHRDQCSLPLLARGVDGCIEVVLATALLLLALESATRALPPIKDSSILYPGFRYAWPDGHARRNSFGLNDAEPGPKTGLRVLLLGDSYVQGAGVPTAERFSSMLTHTLRSSDPRAQVIAGGLCGWDTVDEARFLAKRGPELRPDRVVVCYVLNDAQGTQRIAAEPSRWEAWLQTEARSYFCYRVFRWRSPARLYYWSQVREQHAAKSPSWLRVESALQKIVNWSRKNRIPCELVVLPIFTSDADAVRDVMDEVVQRATTLGFRAFSMLDDFEGRWLDYAVSPQDAHPNAAAHARIAQRLATELHATESTPAALKDPQPGHE